MDSYCALLACRSLNGLLESNFAAPTSFVPFVMVCGLCASRFLSGPPMILFTLRLKRK